MNRPRYEFFTRAGLAQNESCRIGGRHDLNTLQDRSERKPLSHHVPNVVIDADFIFQIQLFGVEAIPHFRQFAVSATRLPRTRNMELLTSWSASESCLANNIVRILVFMQANELRVAEMVVRCPFHILELADQSSFEPTTVRHLRSRQPFSPASSPRLRQI